MKTFSISQAGCTRTDSDVQRIYDYLCANGLNYVGNFRKADLIVVNTCGFHKETEKYSLDVLKFRLQHKKRDAKIIAVGCLANINSDCLRSLGFSDIIGPRELSGLDTLLSAKIKFDSVRIPIEIMDFNSAIGESQFHLFSSAKRKMHEFHFSGFSIGKLMKKVNSTTEMLVKKIIKNKRINVLVSRGCVGNCTYCSIKRAKGQLTSRPLENIIDDLERCLELKVNTIGLETEDLGCYGLDINSTVVELLEALFAYEGKHSFILNDLNPQWLIKYEAKIIPLLIKHHKKIKTLVIPVQSGSDFVLKRMNRPYQIDKVTRLIAELKKHLPQLHIRQHLIIGFPGETEDDFRATQDFVRMMNRYSNVEIWCLPYCDRPNTAASGMDHRLSEEVIQHRINETVKLARNGTIKPPHEIMNRYDFDQ